MGQPASKATSPTVLESSQTINQLQGQGGSLRGHKVFVVESCFRCLSMEIETHWWRMVPGLVSLSTMLANALRMDKLHTANRQTEEESGSRVKVCLLFCTPFCRIFNLKCSKHFTLDRRVWRLNVRSLVEHSSTEMCGMYVPECAIQNEQPAAAHTSGRCSTSKNLSSFWASTKFASSLPQSLNDAF